MCRLKNHFRPDGTCDCPMDGKCCECGKPCNDHDLVADTWWCGECIDKHIDADKAALAKQ
jgi:hypothetical protein